MDYLPPNSASRTPTASTSSIDSLSGSSDTKIYKQSRSRSFGGVLRRHRLSWGALSAERFGLGEENSSSEDWSGGIGGKPYNEQQSLGNISGWSHANHIRRSSDSIQLSRNARKGNHSEEFKATETYRPPGTGFVGTNTLTDSVKRRPWQSIRSEGLSGSLLSPGWSPALSDRLYEHPPAPRNPTHRHLTPQDSYSLLLAYQSSAVTSHSSFDLSAASRNPIDQKIASSSSDQELSPEWHQIVDKSFCESLDKMEQRRQGLWWEIIKGEREYVRDMDTMYHVFIQELRDCRPPVIESTKLEPFIAEVFSTASILSHAHETILRNLMERQRIEWPLLTTATDIYLQTMLEIVDLYEAYMKNYPFAEARVRRESVKNKEFRKFLESRNTASLTNRRDIFTFLSRPVTRLPRIILLLGELLKVTPKEHADKEDIPVLKEMLERVVKDTEHGIEAAAVKIKLWNIAERLLFKKGEITISSIALVPEFLWLLVLSSGTLLAFNLKKMMPTSEPSTWMSMGRPQGQLLNQSGHSVAWIYTGKTKGRRLITYVVHDRNTHGSTLNFLEPMFDNSYPSASSLPDPVFRSFAALHLPGHASSITFFRQTVAIITEKTIVIAEPGNPVYNCVPTAGSTASFAEDAVIVKLLNGQVGSRAEGRPLGMWQTGGDEFILVYDWGACFVTKFGEICRSGAYLVWDLFPVYAVFRSPHLLLFDDSGRAEVRNVVSGKMCETIKEKGLRMMPPTREEQGMLGWSEKGLIQLAEVSLMESAMTSTNDMLRMFIDG
ncbi:hypothetical protein I305_06270 [Cryptococcus gattii E566]|uniref:Signal transducer, putative n=2 Tax=Cryptococcus gattii TaxID=37769 RepID=E6R120_CRYGW|nr:Signal transducer, putative [Cryptococcus gattii WM276]ADV20494.1 Signal transducer, putative [Cryptococcus gattii WM276]KIR76899.1 hypothetical protein I306_06051 [Cryptococcus gattii EJB2]KIY31365.1 hypothetical protein I305_06270 [Cryptococcus gattii E566]KJE00201.1 hypothetical protein I311_06211 [Cryptococcus gattii NT-10]